MIEKLVQKNLKLKEKSTILEPDIPVPGIFNLESGRDVQRANGFYSDDSVIDSYSFKQYIGELYHLLLKQNGQKADAKITEPSEQYV